jgi:hypothetical protein
MRLFARAFVSLVAMTLPVGCQQVEDAPPTFTFDRLRAFNSPTDVVPLEGALLCQMDAETCGLSDAGGRVSVEIPIGVETAVTLTKEGYLPYLFPFVAGPAGRSASFGVESNQLAANQYERVESPYPMGSQGAVFLAARPLNIVGATFELLDATSVTQFYLDEECWFDPNLKATASCDGWGGFTEVNPGVLQAKIGGRVSGCKPVYGWPGDAEDTVRFPVREGYATWVSWNCVQEPP